MISALRLPAIRLPWIVVLVILSAGLIKGRSVRAESLADLDTPGGLVTGAQLVRVTTLSDSGLGSLREALALPGPKIVAFEVGGAVELASDLVIRDRHTTIAGETAPGEGVVLKGGSLRIRASDVLVSHLAIYAGSTADLKTADQRDTISIYGSFNKGEPLDRIVLRNVTVGWSVDENIGVQGRVNGVRVERALVAEALLRGGHPKRTHSMNLFISSTTRRALVLGSVLAAADQRSARFTQANQAAMINNVVAYYGAASTHIDLVPTAVEAGAVDVVGNAYLPYAVSRCPMPVVQVRPELFEMRPDTRIHLADNIALGPKRTCADTPLPPAVVSRLSPNPAHELPFWRIEPAATLFPAILDRVGARPARRNPLDRRIIQSIREGTSRIVDDERDAGGWPTMNETHHKVSPPVTGRLSTSAELAVMAAWLCQTRREVGDVGTCL